MAMAVKPGDLDAVDFDYQQLHTRWLTRVLHSYFRVNIQGMEHLPTTPFVGAGNHSGAAMIPDTLVWVGAYHTSGRLPRLVTLAHDGMFDAYPEKLAWALSKLGAVRAHPEIAAEALHRGFAVQVYPGGDDDACRHFSRRNEIVFAGRTGYVELACAAGVPIVPVVSAGAHEALFVLSEGEQLTKKLGFDRQFRLKRFPLSWSLPWGLWLGPLPGYLPLPTKIDIRVLPPILTSSGDVAAIDARVREAMQHALNQMTKGRRLWIG